MVKTSALIVMAAVLLPGLKVQAQTRTVAPNHASPVIHPVNTLANSKQAVPAVLPAGTVFTVRLNGSLSAARAKPGKKVKAHLVGTVDSFEKFVDRDWSTVIGHVTKAQKRDKNHPESSLAIVFDKLKLKGGKTASFNGVIESVELIADLKQESVPDTVIGHGTTTLVQSPDDMGDIEAFSQYTFPKDNAQGVFIACRKRNVYVSWHIAFTIRVL